MRNLILKGVRQNNLKEIDLSLPLGCAIVVTGPSGSGKSSLAFETIYAEGQRRYMQSLSTYARQFLEKFPAPDAEQISNIPPTIAVEQTNPVRNSRATVGTSTEIYDYYRLLFEKIGIDYCPDCNVPVERLNISDISSRIASNCAGQTILISFRKQLTPDLAAIEDILKELLRLGYSRLVVNGQLEKTEEVLKTGSLNEKFIDVIVDRINVPEIDAGTYQNTKKSKELKARLGESTHVAMELGHKQAYILTENKNGYTIIEDYTLLSRCPKCKKLCPPKSATSFSFNSPLGACGKCSGFGNILELDEDKVIPYSNLSIAKGAINPFTKPSLSHWQKKLIAFCKTAKIDLTIPYKNLPQTAKKALWDGGKTFKGIRGVFSLLEKDKYKLRVRVFLSRYNSSFTCPDCKGARLGEAALRVRIGDKNISEVCELPVEKALNFFKTLSLPKLDRKIAKDLLAQIERRLDYLCSVGLSYLTMSRLTKSLSGGEYQRILLATQLSQGLTDTLYVLDEPSIGLHPKDTDQLIGVLNRLRAQGNSLVLVEHDPQVIQWGEYIVDLGPGAGKRGGEVVFSGSKQQFILSNTSTSRSVKSWKEDCKKALLNPTPPYPNQWLLLKGACENNLQNIDLNMPLNRLVAITGVSGSGKSTLIVDTLYPVLDKILNGNSQRIGKFDSISGFENIQAVELVDQTPIGKSSRSNPITFIKAYDEIRSLFANTREAISKSLRPGHFSFNVSGGRCEECEGEGQVKVDMVFMEDIFVPCQACDEKRFKTSVLSIKYRGKNIDDVLKMTIDEAYDFFKDSPGLRSKLSLVQDVGLGYLELGQPGYTLSGGEAQRIKISRELGVSALRHPKTLFIFDEPTTGLHFDEISKLIQVMRRLLSGGHSVVVIEHNLQIICNADYLIDLGPDGGMAGGHVVKVGTPLEIASSKLPHTGIYLSELLQ